MKNFKFALPIAFSILLLATAVWFPHAPSPEALGPLGGNPEPVREALVGQPVNLDSLASSDPAAQRQGVPEFGALPLPSLPALPQGKPNLHLKRALHKRSFGVGRPSQQALLAQQARMNP